MTDDLESVGRMKTQCISCSASVLRDRSWSGKAMRPAVPGAAISPLRHGDDANVLPGKPGGGGGLRRSFCGPGDAAVRGTWNRHGQRAGGDQGGGGPEDDYTVSGFWKGEDWIHETFGNQPGRPAHGAIGSGARLLPAALLRLDAGELGGQGARARRDPRQPAGLGHHRLRDRGTPSKRALPSSRCETAM